MLWNRGDRYTGFHRHGSIMTPSSLWFQSKFRLRWVYALADSVINRKFVFIFFCWSLSSNYFYPARGDISWKEVRSKFFSTSGDTFRCGRQAALQAVTDYTIQRHLCRRPVARDGFCRRPVAGDGFCRRPVAGDRTNITSKRNLTRICIYTSS